MSWSPLSGLKGVKPPLVFGGRTRDCSPGHAGKEGPQLARTGASQGFPRAAAPVGVFSRGTTRISGSLSCGAREVRSPCGGDGDRVMALESREGTQVHLWLTHVDIWQKPTKYCKAIILQLKNENLKKPPQAIKMSSGDFQMAMKYRNR